MTPQPGIYLDVPDAEYRAWELPSYSTLALFHDPDLCELEIKHALEHPEEPTEEMALGTMVEQAIHAPDGIGANVQKLPPEIKARRGAAWEEFRAANPGIEWLPPSEYAKHEGRIQLARDMAAAVRANDLAGPLLNESNRQVSFVADVTFAGEGGEEIVHRVKGRADYWLPDQGIIIDLKTTSFGNPRKVGDAFWRYAYHVQSALYTDCMAALSGKEVRFYFVTVRSKPPHVVTVWNGHNTWDMDGYYLELGRRAYQVALEQLAGCRRTGNWRGYWLPDAPESRVLSIYVPAWAL